MGRPDASSRDGRTSSHRGGLLTAAAVSVAAAAAVLRRLSPRDDAVDVVNAPSSRRWETLASAVSSALRPRGLDVVAPLRLRWYNDIAPPSAKIAPGGRRGDDALVILVGNSRALWPAFCAAHDADPEVGDAEDPVDTYVARQVDRAITPHAVAHRTFYAHETKPGRLVAVQRMAHVAGVAHLDERCHLSIHPTLGPWFALRAVVVLDDVEGPGDEQNRKQRQIRSPPTPSLARASTPRSTRRSPATNAQTPQTGSGADGWRCETPSLLNTPRDITTIRCSTTTTVSTAWSANAYGPNFAGSRRRGKRTRSSTGASSDFRGARIRNTKVHMKSAESYQNARFAPRPMDDRFVSPFVRVSHSHRRRVGECRGASRRPARRRRRDGLDRFSSTRRLRPRRRPRRPSPFR